MADVTIGGTVRTLRFDLFALSELELRSNKHLGWFIGEIAESRCGPAMALWLLWAGLQHETPKPTIGQVQTLVVALLAEGRTTFDLLDPFVRALNESDLFRTRPSPNATPEAGSPSPTSGSATGLPATSPSSTGA